MANKYHAGHQVSSPHRLETAHGNRGKLSSGKDSGSAQRTYTKGKAKTEADNTRHRKVDEFNVRMEKKMKKIKSRR